MRDESTRIPLVQERADNDRFEDALATRKIFTQIQNDIRKNWHRRSIFNATCTLLWRVWEETFQT